jgi:hypothetical protein
MTIFAVIALNTASIEPTRVAVESAYPGADSTRAGETCWFVSEATLDIKAVSRKLGVRDETQGSGTLTDVLIVWSAIYWGSANPQVWLWLGQKLQQPTPQK